MSETDADAVDVEQFAGETVRLQASITRLMDSPTILTGEVSGSGKTIAVQKPHSEKTFRLDTATIMAGKSEFRDSYGFSLYSPENFQNSQKANLAPGPQAGANQVSEDSDLPEPTHHPVGEDAEGDSEDDDPDAEGDDTSEGEDAPVAVTDGGSDQVYVKSHNGTKPKAYHLDESCGILQRASGYSAKDPSVVRPDLDECHHCGDPEPTEDDDPSGQVVADGGEGVPLSDVSEGDTIHVTYDSPRSDRPQEREGEVTEVITWDMSDEDDITGDLDTIRFQTADGECQLKVARRSPHILEQMSNGWTKLGRTRDVTVTPEPEPLTDGGVDVEPAAEDADMGHDPYISPITGMILTVLAMFLFPLALGVLGTVLFIPFFIAVLGLSMFPLDGEDDE